MRRLFPHLLLAALLLGAVSSSRAWLIQGGGYSGPGNIVTFTAWYGVRSYSAALAATGTQKCCDLRRASDSATCTALFKTNGNLDLTVGTPCNGNTQTVTAWVGASTAKVAKLYDQTAGNHCGGSTCDVAISAAGQPTLLLTGCGTGGTLPCIQAIGNGSATIQLVSAFNITPAGSNLSLTAVGNRVSGTSAATWITENAAGSNNNGVIGTPGSSTLWQFFGMSGTAANNAWHTTNDVAINGGTSVFNIDGTETTSTAPSVSTAAGPPKIAIAAQFSTVTALIGEAGFADGVAWTLAQRKALCQQSAAYWGITASC